MKYIGIHETPKEGTLMLLPLGDLHYGSLDCNKKKFEDIIEFVRKKDNCRVILMGDLIDAGLKDSVGGGAFDNEATPEQQMTYVIEKLEPIKKKIWVLLSGNHEERIRERTSIDISKLIAKALGIKYAGDTAFIKAKIGNINYTIYATHGNSGAISSVGKLGSVLRLGAFADADIYLHAHTHEIMNHSTEYFKVDMKNKMIVADKRYYILTGHFLNYGGYAEKKCYAPGKSGVPEITLDKKTKDVNVAC